jgi:hypothetical protein
VFVFSFYRRLGLAATSVRVLLLPPLGLAFTSARVLLLPLGIAFTSVRVLRQTSWWPARMLLLGRWRWAILEHPSHSPGIRPCDYDLFAKMKEPLRGTRHSTREEIIRAVGRLLLDINRSGHADGVTARHQQKLTR